METFGSAEIWNLRASFMLIGTDAKADIPLPDTVRRYFFPGVTHGGGRGGFSSAETAANGCELPANPAPSAPMRSALTKALVDWVTTGAAMPPNRYPTIADGTLVPETAAFGFPVVPGRPAPVMSVRCSTTTSVPNSTIRTPPAFSRRRRRRSNDRCRSSSSRSMRTATKWPASSRRCSLAPLGTYTGWNVTAAGPLKGQSCGLNGGFMPFAKTKAERVAKGDPRPSLEERYHSHAEYVQVVSAAAARLVKERYLLQPDADAMIKQADASDVLR